MQYAICPWHCEWMNGLSDAKERVRRQLLGGSTAVAKTLQGGHTSNRVHSFYLFPWQWPPLRLHRVGFFDILDTN